MHSLRDHLEKLSGFKVVVESGSFRKAAERLHISQPSLSHSVKVLEELLEKPLLTRTPKGVKPTSAGLCIYKFAQNLEQDVENLEMQLKSSEKEMIGSLRVGVYESIAIYFWPSVFKTLTERYPNFFVHLSTGRSSSLLERLKANQIDLSVSVEPSLSHGIETIELYEDQFDFYASPELITQLAVDQKGQRPTFSSKELKNTPLILFLGALSDNGRPLEEVLVKEGIIWNSHYEVESFEVAKEFAIKGIGIAVLPKRVAAFEVQRRRLKAVRLKGFNKVGFGNHRICISVQRDLLHDHQVRTFVETLTSIINADAPSQTTTPLPPSG